MEDESQEQVKVGKQPFTKIFIGPSIILMVILLLQIFFQYRSVSKEPQHFVTHHMLTPLPTGEEVIVIVIGDKRDINERQKNIIMGQIARSIKEIDLTYWDTGPDIVEDPNEWLRYRYTIIR